MFCGAEAHRCDPKMPGIGDVNALAQLEIGAPWPPSPDVVIVSTPRRMRKPVAWRSCPDGSRKGGDDGILRRMGHLPSVTRGSYARKAFLPLRVELLLFAVRTQDECAMYGALRRTPYVCRVYRERGCGKSLDRDEECG